MADDSAILHHRVFGSPDDGILTIAYLHHAQAGDDAPDLSRAVGMMCIPSVVTINRSIFHASKQGLGDAPAASLAFLLHQSAGWVGELRVSPDFWCFANEFFVNVYMGCSMASECDWSCDTLGVVSLDKLYVRAKFCCGNDPARSRHDCGVALGTGPSRVVRAIIEGPNPGPGVANWLSNALLTACDGRSAEKIVRCNLGVPVMSNESVLYKVPGELCSFFALHPCETVFQFLRQP